jgi:AraC-like DNA-binding protein
VHAGDKERVIGEIEGSRTGPEILSGRARIPRHRHADAYAAIIISGGYEEAGDLGRWRVGPGDVLVHHSYEAHINRIAGAGCRLVNLPLPGSFPRLGCMRITDPELIERLVRDDLPGAVAALMSQAIDPVPALQDWPDLLAAQLQEPAPIRLGEWADQLGLAPSSVSRGFRQVYGVRPSRYRLEARARRALGMIAADCSPIASIAQDCGFADQAHLSRTISSLTGRTPKAWRRDVKFVQSNR